MMTGTRAIELDFETADALEEAAQSRGQTLVQFLRGLAEADAMPPPDLQSMREYALGPWSPQALAEDVRVAEAFDRTGEGVAFEDVSAWMQSWGTANELPVPRPRKL